MFFRTKKSGDREYVQLVSSVWVDGKPRQKVLMSLGRVDQLKTSPDQIATLARSAARLSDSLLLLDSADSRASASAVRVVRIGAPLIFERLWRESGCQGIIRDLLGRRKFAFDVERAIFLTVLHRLCDPGSDRAADRWRADYDIAGVDELELHQLYRAMAWLGEPLSGRDQVDATPFSPRTIKDEIEERLFAARTGGERTLRLALLDTTSIYFEGSGGTTLGRRGHSKDSRPDLKQMIVAAVLDETGYPVCAEQWPGNTADVSSLLPVVKRLKQRFGLIDVCIVADRGMFSSEARIEVENLGWTYILGARMRSVKEVRDEVLSRAGRFKEVQPPDADRSPLKVKDVFVGDRRYVVCLNEDQKRKDAADREAILESLGESLKQGPKALVGNRGYRKFLKRSSAKLEIDLKVVEADARFDGKWVLATNSERSSTEIALNYKQLWMVEDFFRSTKSLLATRPIYHRRDDTIRGHVFCSFLALVLRRELQMRMAASEQEIAWTEAVSDLESLTRTDIVQDDKTFRVRSDLAGSCAAIFRAVGVGLPRKIAQG